MLEVVDCSRRELLRLAAQESEDILDAGAKQGALTLERESSHGATMLEAARPAPERPRLSQPGPMARTSTTKAQGLVEFFTQAEGKCNWIPIEAPHKTPSRYMEFFPPSSTQAPDAEIITPTATSSGNSGKKSRVRKEPSKACALCTHPFPVSSLEAVVSRQAVYRLRQKWAKQTGSKDSEIVEKKFRFRLYDELRVCLFCSQLFNDYGASSDTDDEDPQPRRPKPARPMNHEEPIIVTVVGKARLEEIFFDKLAINERPHHAHAPKPTHISSDR
ncbi:Hypothetical Protein FCC1311_095122 [Hondaea fermentalgiana]|uniref:Uncharacterized protein n=1 Tax=Hondaea fermentalgiana TaxID=2315210 RepID=A0A2R5GU57_9STRA|nr:Hypothetical Protein FCC1311_095122 [Hondaea fermentalgiana]|eukprot:GBG33288.1 Hypothetical Protein FCC1311_095122 [Hondaea fermentalgiana]